MRSLRLAFALPLAFVLGGCPKSGSEQPLTEAQAQSALQEAQGSSAADSLTAANIEISTNFTLGAGLTQAATEISAAIQSQLPCADVTLEDATLTVEWGVNPGNCSYRGHTFTGTSTISVQKNDTQVLVHHEWNGLSNGVVTVDGSADVTWDASAMSRHVVHHTSWTYAPTGRTGTGDGDRTQTPLDGDLTQGISVSGTRSWTGKDGSWDLAIDDVSWRWADPIPEAGSYSLATPFDKSVTLSFSRVDASTIGVTVTGARGSFTFKVTSTGS
ncbi:MAG TPA: hypothetical protein VMI54_27610 [Polyangiaceae bacterium]|nr:hypothetical protein [Polyangiaceae bacterium]